METSPSSRLESAVSAVVGLSSRIPEGAFTADILGRERAGHGVVISPDGIVATVGYLITEATEVWLRTRDGQSFPAHVLGFDQDSGIGLVQALTREKLSSVELGDSDDARPGREVVVAGHGGSSQIIAASVVGRREFAGYWEYVLDEAIFTAPAHPNWGGAAVLGHTGRLLGIGSLHVGHRGDDGVALDLNMVIPINLLKPIMNDIVRFGRVQKPARPWLGLYASDEGGRITIMGASSRAPAARAGIRRGDIVRAVGETPVTTLQDFFRAIWRIGDAGVEVPLQIERAQGKVVVRVQSGDRRDYLKGPVLH